MFRLTISQCRLCRNYYHNFAVFKKANNVKPLECNFLNFSSQNSFILPWSVGEAERSRISPNFKYTSDIKSVSLPLAQNISQNNINWHYNFLLAAAIFGITGGFYTVKNEALPDESRGKKYVKIEII